MPPAALQHAISRLPSRDAQGQPQDIEVRVVTMTPRHVTQWHQDVQPVIDARYMHAGRAQTGQRVRADVGWRWKQIYRRAQLHSLVAKLPGNLEQAVALSVVIDTGETADFPIGMLTAVPQLHCTALGSTRHRAFAWYLADAPKETYAELLQRPPVSDVAKALLDCAIQAALDLGEDGSLLLHADPNGGPRLRRFYCDRCRMDQLPVGAPPITPLWRRSHTEEYFHFDDVQAIAFCQSFDPYR